MPGIFDIGDVPAWLNPVRGMMERGEKDAQNFSSNFSQAFGQASSQAFQKQQVQDQRNFAIQQQEQLAKKLGPIASALANTKTPEQSWDVVSQNSTWLADPQTSPFVEKFLKTQTDVAKAQSATVAGKIAIDAGKQFYDELNKIPAMQANIIRGMGDPSNPIAPPTAAQLSALNQTKYTLNQQASIDALARGQTSVETELNAKGEVVQKYKTPPATQGSPEFQKSLEQSASVDLPDGSMMWRGAGSRQWYHLDKNTGTSKQLNDQQLQSMAKRFSESGDNKIKQKGAEIDDYLFKKFKGQTGQINSKPDTSSKFKVGGLYKSKSGNLKYLGGDPDNPNSWQKQ